MRSLQVAPLGLAVACLLLLLFVVPVRSQSLCNPTDSTACTSQEGFVCSRIAASSDSDTLGWCVKRGGLFAPCDAENPCDVSTDPDGPIQILLQCTEGFCAVKDDGGGEPIDPGVELPEQPVCSPDCTGSETCIRMNGGETQCIVLEQSYGTCTSSSDECDSSAAGFPLHCVVNTCLPAQFFSCSTDGSQPCTEEGTVCSPLFEHFNNPEAPIPDEDSGRGGAGWCVKKGGMLSPCDAENPCDPSATPPGSSVIIELVCQNGFCMVGDADGGEQPGDGDNNPPPGTGGQEGPGEENPDPTPDPDPDPVVPLPCNGNTDCASRPGTVCNLESNLCVADSGQVPIDGDDGGQLGGGDAAPSGAQASIVLGAALLAATVAIMRA